MNLNSHTPAFWDNVINIIFALVILTALVTGFTSLICVIRSEGKVDYCYVESDSKEFVVKGHITWRSDHYIASTPSLEEARKIVQDKVVCPK